MFDDIKSAIKWFMNTVDCNDICTLNINENTNGLDFKIFCDKNGSQATQEQYWAWEDNELFLNRITYTVVFDCSYDLLVNSYEKMLAEGT